MACSSWSMSCKNRKHDDVWANRTLAEDEKNGASLTKIHSYPRIFRWRVMMTSGPRGLDVPQQQPFDAEISAILESEKKRKIKNLFFKLFWHQGELKIRKTYGIALCIKLHWRDRDTLSPIAPVVHLETYLWLLAPGESSSPALCPCTELWLTECLVTTASVNTCKHNFVFFFCFKLFSHWMDKSQHVLLGKDAWERGAVGRANTHVIVVQIRCMCMLSFALVNILRRNFYNNFTLIIVFSS